jgi:hypothetical protein
VVSLSPSDRCLSEVQMPKNINPLVAFYDIHSQHSTLTLTTI